MNAVADLFAGDPRHTERLDWPDGEFRYIPAFWPPGCADALMTALQDEVPWQVHPVRMFGREIPSPRQSGWFGDPGTDYRYSGVSHPPMPWTPTLTGIRRDIEQRLDIVVNSVLANRYRDGADCMGWHSDDEPELGARPVIVSASFGASRRFALRHRRLPLRQSLWLEHGSVLIMAGDSQACWQHALPATRAACGPRINLTFRFIHHTAP